jgi:hypothetical protein
VSTRGWSRLETNLPDDVSVKQAEISIGVEEAWIMQIQSSLNAVSAYQVVELESAFQNLVLEVLSVLAFAQKTENWVDYKH